jgi:hypothetical protein
MRRDWSFSVKRNGVGRYGSAEQAAECLILMYACKEILVERKRQA